MSLGSNKARDPQKSPSWDSAPASAKKMQRLDQLANLGLLSAGMAHEIKNSMVAIKTFVDLLLEKNPDAELGEVVRTELQRINAIVAQMLRFAAPGSATFHPVAVQAVLDRSLRLLRPQMSGKLIALKTDYQAATDVVSGDDTQLQQVFMNLLLNAIEAMGTDGELTVCTATTDDGHGGRTLKIEIQDTGMGIAPEHLEHLFEPFFTTKKNGTGLGLPISRRIIEEHHGSIQTHSATGQGSVFSLLLPASAA